MSDSVIETFYTDEDFTLDVEMKDETLFLHCYVNRYSKDIKKRMKEVFNVLTEVSYLAGWDALHSYTQNPKFTKIFPGCFKIGEFEFEGETYEVMRWELE